MGVTMTFQREPEWQRLYVDALLETDPLKLVGRVATAEKAILIRVEELCRSSDGAVEWQALEDAITGMSVLKREIINFSIGTKIELRPTVVMPRACAN
jgi:hypothetical protein